MCVNFKQAFINHTKDGVLDKKDFQQLKQKADDLKISDPDSEDALNAENIISSFEKQKTTATITYSYTEAGKAEASINLEFEFTPTYSEKEIVSGDNMSAAISNISQSDTLKETKSDGSRCGAATLMNIALRSLADKTPEKSPAEIFAVFAKKVGVPTAFTYENVHKAQDKLYNYANQDGNSGLSAKSSYRTDQEGNVKSVQTMGEIKRLADYLGLKSQTLIGPHQDTLSDKKAAIDSFFDKNPKGSLVIGVHLDKDGKITPVDGNNEQNHFVEIYKNDNAFMMKDTGAVSNGNSPGYDIKLEGEEIKNSLLYNNPGSTIGMTR